MKKKIYAVRKGRIPGIYDTWDEAKSQVLGFSGEQFRGFTYMTEREQEDETVEYSLAQARKLAMEYLGDIPNKSGEEYSREVELKELQEELESGREVFARAGLTTDDYGNSPWIGILLRCVTNRRSFLNIDMTKFPLRYSCTSVYAALIYLVLSEDEVLPAPWEDGDGLADDWDDEDEEAAASIRDIWHKSKDYIRLKQRFEEYGMDRTHLREEFYCRAKVAAEKAYKDYQISLHKPTESYMALKRFIRQGGHTVMGLYRELIGNPIYRQELQEVSGAFTNPDLGMEAKSYTEGSEAPIQYIKTQTDAVAQELYEKVVGQDEVIEQFRNAWFHKERKAGTDNRRRGPRQAYLFAGPPGVGKTFVAEIVADTLKIPYKRFDMSAYSTHNDVAGLVGFERTYTNARSGVLTDFVRENPRCVLLFDEIEKAHRQVIMIFLQILDEGRCIDKYYDTNVDFRNTIIILTTNAGRQLYQDAENENLALLSDSVIMDALKKDIHPDTKAPFFPPEIISRMSSHTVIMFNHLRADAILEIIRRDMDRQTAIMREKHGYDMSSGQGVIAKTALYSMGGGLDARNASVLAGKLIDRALLSLLTLVDEKMGLNRQESIREIAWEPDFSGAADEILRFYSGEKDCTVAVFGEAEMISAEIFTQNKVRVRMTADPEDFMKILQEEEVILAAVDYEYGMKEEDRYLSIADCRTEGSRVFCRIREEYKNSIPVYILYSDAGYAYSRSEKGEICRRGAKGFIKVEELQAELPAAYTDICCQRAVETLSLRHQKITYDLKQELDEPQRIGRIVFCNFRLETALEAEDRDLLLSADMRPDTHWADVYVPDSVKNGLMSCIKYLKDPRSFRQDGLRAPRGVLLVGEPGTGKTSIARLVATESGVSFLNISSDQLKSKGADEVHRIYRAARKYAPAVLFIDEVDTIGGSRQAGTDNSVLNALLTEMDGFCKTDDRPILLMAATNLEKEIDDALRSRFDQVFELPPADRNGIKWMLERMLQKHSDRFRISSDEMDEIAIRFEGISFRMLENILEAALREAVRSGILVDHIRLYEMFDEMRMGDARGDVTPEAMRRIAYHEAGHALIGLAHSVIPNYMSIVARSNYGGFVENSLDKDGTKESMLNRICIFLGGRAAETVCGYSLSSGAGSDLSKATQLAKVMVCSLGMYEEEFGLTVISEGEFHNNEKAKALVDKILSEQSEKAAAIISSNREALERLVDAVMDSKTKSLTKKEIVAAYEGR